MPNFYETYRANDGQAELMQKHQRAQQVMLARAEELGNLGVETVQLWQQAAAMVDPVESAEAGTAAAIDFAPSIMPVWLQDPIRPWY